MNTELTYRKVVAAGTGLLAALYIAVLLVDVFRVVRPSFVEELFVPFLWDYFFREASLVEFFQWIFLAGFTVTSAYLAGGLKNGEKRFWMLLSVGGALMLIEDAGNIRHFIIRDLLTLSWNMLNVAETLIFGLIVLPVAAALLLYREDVFDQESTKKLMVTGIIFYGLAASISGPADLTGLKDATGEFMKDSTDYLSGGELSPIYEEVDQDIKDRRPTGYMDVSARFVDFLLEESLELLGATFLLASAVSYLKVRPRE